MTTIAYIKMAILLNLLIWYRKNFTVDVDGVISPLDSVINDTARIIEKDVVTT
jgi:hypothetical protein